MGLTKKGNGMEKVKKLSSKEKEVLLIKKIEKAKGELSRLQARRRAEIGKLAFKHGLNGVDNQVLDSAFEKLAKELVNVD